MRKILASLILLALLVVPANAAYLTIPAGTTSKIITFPVFDSSSTVGATLTGLAYNTGSLTAYYNRTGAAGAATAISLVTMTKGTWTSSGFVAVDETNMPGWYELGIPDAALASGATSVEVMLKGAANMVPVCFIIELTATSNQDAVRGGMTALPNANAEAAGGLYTRGTGAGQINQAANGQIDANLTRILNTAVSTPATAGVLDVNVKNMNNVAATSITTISANQGTTAPINFTGSGATAYVKVDLIDIGGAAVSTSTAQIGVNAVNIGGTAQTGRDIGASVLLSVGTGTGQVNLSSGAVPITGDLTSTMKTSVAVAVWDAVATDYDDALSMGNKLNSAASAGDPWNTAIPGAYGAGTAGYILGNGVKIQPGTGTGQLSVTSGVIAASTNQINGTSIAGTGTRVADAFVVMFNVASSTFTTASINQTGDAFGRLGAPAGASVSADIAAVAAGVWNVAVPGSFGAGTSGYILGNVGTTTEIGEAVWGTARSGNADAGTFGEGVLISVGTGTGQINLSSGKAPATLATADVTGNLPANVLQIDTVNVSTHAAGMFPADLRDIAGSAVSTSSAQLGVNVVNIGGTAQTGRDIGASVLLSVGTGTGQVNLTSGAVPVTGDLSTTMKTSVENAVWEAASGSHNNANTMGAKLNAAASAGDPWSTALPGAYSAGSAGYILGTNLDSTITSRAPATTAPDNKIATDANGRVQIQVGTSAGQINISSGKVPATLASGDVTGNVTADVQTIGGAAMGTHTAGYFPTDLRYIGGAALSTTTAQLGVNIVNFGGTAVTGRDIGASVLISSGTGAGQLSVTSGKVAATIASGDVTRTLKKNQALAGFQFFMKLSSDHISPATGKTITAYRSLDGGAFAGTANSAAELSDGWYIIDLAASDLNGSTVAFRFTASGCDTTQLTFILEP